MSAGTRAPFGKALRRSALFILHSALALSALAGPKDDLLTGAAGQIGQTVSYVADYVVLPYPGGDVPISGGVCTDVVIRSLRATGIDLQQLVHDDILRRPAAYATVTRPDRNIDHRRVSPMLVYLRAHATSLPTTFDGASLATWQPGDVVVWGFRPCPACTPDHVGIVSDVRGPRGLPLVLHNIGPAPSEDDRLDAFNVLGHFRVRKD